jgi:hypothetical protein
MQNSPLTNPKEIESRPKIAQLDSELDGVIDQAGKFTVSQFRLRPRPFSNATSSSWLELTNPSAAAHALLEYGDVVSLKGRVTIKKNDDGKVAYVLLLARHISILPSAKDPAENEVSEVRLLGFEQTGGSIPDVDTMGSCHVTGTLNYAPAVSGGSSVTLKVHGYEYETR